MSTLISDSNLLEAFIEKLCQEDILLQRLRTALFPVTTVETSESDVASHDADTVRTAAVVNPPTESPTTQTHETNVDTAWCCEEEESLSSVTSREAESNWVNVPGCASSGYDTNQATSDGEFSFGSNPAEIESNNNNDHEQSKPCNIKIKNIFGKIITINVQPNDTIADVKEKIYKSEVDEQRILIYRKFPLEKCYLSDHEKIKDMDDPSNLSLFPASSGDDEHFNSYGRFNITVKLLVGRIIAMNVKPSDTIANVKAKLYEATGWFPHRQIVITRCRKPGSDEMDAKILCNTDVLRDHDIHEGSMLYMLIICSNNNPPKF
jgi:hypothetical protein